MNKEDMKKGAKYVCPMHPEEASDKPGKCDKCGMPYVAKAMKGKDFDKEGHGGHEGHDHSSMMASPEAAADFLRRFFIVTVLLVPLALFSGLAVEYLGVPDFSGREYLQFGIASVIFYFGLVFFQHARHEIIARQYGMMTLVSLGVGAGYLFSAVSTFLPSLEVEFYLEIATLIWILLFGHYLEAKSSTAAGDALDEVAKLLPKKAHRVKSQISNHKSQTNQIEEVELSELKEGDVVLVKAGEKVPADGEIIKGEGNFNEAHLTGESKPVEKVKGQEVAAGAISIDGSVEVKLMRVGESSTIGQIQSLISDAKQTKPSAQRLADRASKWLTFSALFVSILTLFVWSFLVGQTFVFSVTLAITVLVIACPHALGLAIPTVSTIATRLAVKNGVFIKDMSKVETIKKANYVVFDKTGTLTQGNFSVTKIIPFVNSKSQARNTKQYLNNDDQNTKLNREQKELLRIAGAIEEHSTHFLGMAILAYLKEKKVKANKASKIKNLSGRGMQGNVSGKIYYLGNERLMREKKVWNNEAKEVLSGFSKEGMTPVFVADKDKILGAFGLSDQVKDDSKEAVADLHKLDVSVAMLTGDTDEAAKVIADRLGIDKVFSEVLPEDKYKYIKKLQDSGNVVLMAGDGVNDAPALTQADAGVAIGAGTDVAVEAGDIVLTESNPRDIVKLVVLSRKVYRKMIENLFWALGYNVLAIPAAAGLFIPLGFRLTPAVGALLMSVSSVIVVVNAMSLRKAELNIK